MWVSTAWGLKAIQALRTALCGAGRREAGLRGSDCEGSSGKTVSCLFGLPAGLRKGLFAGEGLLQISPNRLGEDEVALRCGGPEKGRALTGGKPGKGNPYNQ